MAPSSPAGPMPSSVTGAPPPVPPSVSPRELRKRTVWAFTSKEARDEPSCEVQMRGPPVAASAVRRPSTSTLEPFLRYWLQVSAILPQTETRNQIVSLIDSPLLLVYWRLVATEKEVTGWPEGV